MSFFSRVRRWWEDGYRQQGEMSRLRRLIFSQARLYVHVAREMMTGGYLQRAGALSFTTLLTLVPLIALSFSIYAAFGGADRARVEAAATHLLSRYVLGPAQPSQEPASPAGPRVEPVTYAETERGTTAGSEQITEWSDMIAGAIVRLAGRASSAKITTVGAAFFIMACVLLFCSIESGFNAIWRVRSSRRFWMKVSVFCTILFLSPLLIGLSVYISAALAPAGDYFHEFGLASAILERLAALAPSFLITWFAFFLAYMIIPHARVVWRNALLGAFVAAILWEAAKLAFGAYVGHMVTYQRAYGSLAAIPIFMVWIFITWLIALFGAGVAYTSQHLGALETKRRRDMDGGLVSAPLALSLVLEIARRFADNRGPVSSAELAGAAGTSEDEIRDTLRPLVRGKILSLSTGAGFRYQPAKPLENIRLTEVIDSLREKHSSVLVLPSCREVVLQLIGRTQKAEARELQGITVKDILAAESADE